MIWDEVAQVYKPGSGAYVDHSDIEFSPSPSAQAAGWVKGDLTTAKAMAGEVVQWTVKRGVGTWKVTLPVPYINNWVLSTEYGPNALVRSHGAIYSATSASTGIVPNNIPGTVTVYHQEYSSVSEDSQGAQYPVVGVELRTPNGTPPGFAPKKSGTEMALIWASDTNFELWESIIVGGTLVWTNTGLNTDKTRNDILIWRNHYLQPAPHGVMFKKRTIVWIYDFPNGKVNPRYVDMPWTRLSFRHYIGDSADLDLVNLKNDDYIAYKNGVWINSSKDWYTKAEYTTVGGPAGANKPLLTNANGKIDLSLIALSGAPTYKGDTNPVTTPPPAGSVAGSIFMANAAGTVGAGWPGATGKTVKVGDTLIFDGTNWSVVASSVDLTQFYTKNEVDAKYATIVALTKAISDEVARADATYATKSDLTARLAALRAQLEAVFAKTADVQLALDDKADQITTYTKLEVDALLVPVQTAANAFNPSLYYTSTIADAKFQTQTAAATDLLKLQTQMGTLQLAMNAVQGTTGITAVAADAKYELKSDAALHETILESNRKIAAEVTRADATYLTKAKGDAYYTNVQQVNDEIDKRNFLDANILASKNYASTADVAQVSANLNNAMVATLGNYVPKTDVIQASAGPASVGKVVGLDLNGKIDASMLNLPGGMVYKGVYDPTTTNPPVGVVAGYFYVAAATGKALATWPGIAGKDVATGDGLIFDGTNWASLAAEADVAALTTKLAQTQADMQIANTYILALEARVVALENLLKGVVRTPAAGTVLENISFPTTLSTQGILGGIAVVKK